MLPPILQRVQALGFAVFENGNFDLNLVGIRSKNRQSNKFDDMMTCTYKEGGRWVTKYWACTTDPGTYWLEHPSRVAGTAILVPGQYRGCYRLDKHQGRYEALCQREGKVQVYRDPNMDEILDMSSDTIQEGFYGINIHRASTKRASTQVDRWSAGCQVIADKADFAELILLCHEQVERGFKTFTYTLIEEE
jgi:hypothetical protein